MDIAQLVKPFADITVQTFKSFVGYDLSPMQPFFTDEEMDLHSDITGVIGISGPLRGAVIISMKKDLAMKITSRLTGSVPAEVDADVVDAIGEVTNIIAGNAKPNLPDGEKMIISLPTVIKGDDHAIIWPSKQRRILCIPFDVVDNEVFHLLVAVGIETPL